jgi:predicted ribonuclease YlaK
VVFGVAEPQGDGLPGWLNLAVPDDRLVASALLLQSEHPGSWLAVVTSDLNLQTKLAAAGLPFVEGADPNATDIS